MGKKDAHCLLPVRIVFLLHVLLDAIPNKLVKSTI